MLSFFGHVAYLPLASRPYDTPATFGVPLPEMVRVSSP